MHRPRADVGRRRVRRGLFGLAIGLASCSSGLLGLHLPTGTQTATIEVTVPRSGEPSFRGTIAGGTLTGKVVGRPSYTGDQPLSFAYQGRLGGHRYVLRAAIRADQPVLPKNKLVIAFNVTGSYGSKAIDAKASFDVNATLAHPDRLTLTVPFDGHIGAQHVTGSATATMKGKGWAIAATFSIH